MYFRRYDLCGKDSVDATVFAYAEKKKPITNADRIRAMTDEELAEWLTMIEKRVIENALSKPFKYTDDQLKADWLDWLKQEVKDED